MIALLLFLLNLLGLPFKSKSRLAAENAALLGGAAVILPLAARAQRQSDGSAARRTEREIGRLCLYDVFDRRAPYRLSDDIAAPQSR